MDEIKEALVLRLTPFPAKTYSTTSALTIIAVATRRWAISVRWNLSGVMRAVTLNYLSTSAGIDQTHPGCTTVKPKAGDVYQSGVPHTHKWHL